MSRPLTDQEAATLRETIAHKGKIEGVRFYRALTGATLIEAVRLVGQAADSMAAVEREAEPMSTYVLKAGRAKYVTERPAPVSVSKPRRGSGKILNVDLPADAVAALDRITKRTGRPYTQTVAIALLDLAALTEGTQEAEPYQEPLESWPRTGDAP